MFLLDYFARLLCLTVVEYDVIDSYRLLWYHRFVLRIYQGDKVPDNQIIPVPKIPRRFWELNKIN